MNNLSKRLKNLLNQVTKLNLTFDELKGKNDDLELKNKNLRYTLSLRQEKIKALKEERELIINAKSLTDVGMSSKEARHKINELIRGIDKCIAQLNQ